MQSRHSAPPNELDFFPTPPWATRAFLRALEGISGDLTRLHCWEPACGVGHMAWVLAERFQSVAASDIFAHPWAAPHRDSLVLSHPLDFLDAAGPAYANWIITNPPFKTAVEFAERGLDLATHGVALLVRTSWLEGADRFERLFAKRPPAAVFQYVERVPMTRGRWDPDASTATSYCWVVWIKGDRDPTQFRWIPPGSKKRFSRPEDLVFAARGDTPLFEQGSDR